MPPQLDESYTKEYVLGCRAEAESAKVSRMALNRDNFSMYQLEHDFSHKRPGQSREVLAKTRNATEQTKAFFQQALADLADFFRITAKHNKEIPPLMIQPEEAQKLLNYMLGKANYFSHVGGSVQSGILGSLAISKVRGEMVPKPKFTTRKSGKGQTYSKKVVVDDQKSWELRLDIIRQEDYFPDPHGVDLYRIHNCMIDLYKVKQLAQGDDAIYSSEKVSDLKGWTEGSTDESKKSQETGQDSPTGGVRPRVKLTEFWGTIVDRETGDILAENVVATLANDERVIRMASENPFWHQKSDIIAAALIEVANSVWGVALMDAGTKHTRSLIEVFNLILDSAMKAVWGISQIRIDALEDVSQVTDSVRWGTALKTNASLPVGGKVMEEIITGQIPPEVITVYNMLTQEATTSMFTSDLRMGMQSSRDIKATQVVATENSITGVFQGLAKNFEQKKIQPELELSWQTIAQNWDLIDKEVFISLFGADRGAALAQLEPQEVFVQTVNGYRFEVFGISLTLRRQADFRKWTTLLQTIGASEVLIEAFLKQYSFEKFLGEIMTSIDIDKSKIENDEAAAAPAAGGAGPGAPMEQPGGAPGASPQMMGQVPSAANTPTNPLAAAFAGQQMNMPSAQAIRG